MLSVVRDLSLVLWFITEDPTGIRLGWEGGSRGRRCMYIHN